MLNNKIITLLMSCVISASCLALESDFSQNIVIDAKKQQLEIKTNTLSFTGDVEVKQGSLRMKAERLEVIKADEQNPNSQDILRAIGSPATYKQTLESGETLVATAKNIQYKVKDRILTLTGNATISQQSSQVSGDTIEYNLVEQKLIASSSNKAGQKVRTVLTPKGSEE
ncbi:lipopolysaccharide transport, periplasmic binding component, LptA [Catenovulum agarivorans DS-2]|uniref:Lipopolysaccharide export system protein LptA n=1 Tax=Catenovulum agarivorans DS-2 TaxID=1328313 RepID=W7QV19_9ALTE|nr:lipopolysaccharide transport periplasmic protein LptA [Catenovulum agarivorans]EWH09130.1 lipopolysaccharide transport, periplasmic binding component, LptA [Catenovulum agarivorans DS-2]